MAEYLKVIEAFNKASADILDYMEAYPSSAPSLARQIDKLSNEAQTIAINDKSKPYANSQRY